MRRLATELQTSWRGQLALGAGLHVTAQAWIDAGVLRIEMLFNGFVWEGLSDKAEICSDQGIENTVTPHELLLYLLRGDSHADGILWYNYAGASTQNGECLSLYHAAEQEQAEGRTAAAWLYEYPCAVTARTAFTNLPGISDFAAPASTTLAQARFSFDAH